MITFIRLFVTPYYYQGKIMKIGILETGQLRDAMIGRFDPYPVMFERFVGLAGDDFEFETFCVIGGEMPPSVYACDGWLITGSRHGVYDKLTWMAPLEDFIRELAAARMPLIGVCFGHQIIAEALGGEVVKSDKGWGVGLQQYRIEQAHAWMESGPQQVAIYAYHQDQVVKCPASAQVFLSSEFCPFAGLNYGDSIISVQAHPEFEADFENFLLETFGGSVVPAAVTARAQATMSGSADTRLLASWFANFFLSHGDQCQAE
jgi:GMP synthase-like glutamine amidotransferase